MGPFLDALADGKPQATRMVIQRIADHFCLTDEERARRVPSGDQTYLSNRAGWARTYLKKAGLVESLRRGVVQITVEGQKVLASKPSSIDSAFLRRYSSFNDFESGVERPDANSTKAVDSVTVSSVENATPEETIESAYKDIRRVLASDLLTQIANCSPLFFERLVLKLLIAMGYGGTLQDAAQHTGRSGDGGLDGVIKEDKLGLDIIAIQAKRWEGSVGRPVVQAFAGSMEGHRARKGVLMTTSTFSRDARDYVRMIERKIVLIDGEQLAELMIDHDIGVSAAQTYTIKRVDSDFFTEDEV